MSVPANLCALVPDRVADEDAAFTVLGAFALEGIRLVQPTLGEAVLDMLAGRQLQVPPGLLGSAHIIQCYT